MKARPRVHNFSVVFSSMFHAKVKRNTSAWVHVSMSSDNEEDDHHDNNDYEDYEELIQ